MEQAIITGGHRQMHWAPNMDRLPKPMWRPGAPIGFEAAMRWMQARNLDKEITLAPGSHGACSSTDIIVPKPAGTCNGRLRIRGKQPAAVAMAQQVPVITMPSMATPRPRATYDKPKTGLDDLTPEEETEVAQLSGIKRNQALKRMGHNKNAEESGKHYILEAVDGSLKCRDCDMAGRWSEWPFFAVQAKCKRGYNGESIVRGKMRTMAVQHNTDAEVQGRHVVDLDPELDRFKCRNCMSVQPRTVKHFIFLKALCQRAGSAGA